MSTLNLDGTPRKVSAVRGNDPAVTKAAIAAFAAGHTLKEIGSAIGMSADSARRVLLRAGVTMRKRGRWTGTHRSQYRPEMRALRADGWTFAAIGAKYGVTRQCIQQLLARP